MQLVRSGRNSNTDQKISLVILQKQSRVTAQEKSAVSISSEHTTV